MLPYKLFYHQGKKISFAVLNNKFSTGYLEVLRINILCALQMWIFLNNAILYWRSGTTVNTAGAQVFPLHWKLLPLRYFNLTTRKTLGDAGDKTKLTWFHGSAKHTQPGGGQCVGDLRLCSKNEEVKGPTCRRYAARKHPCTLQWHFFYHSAFAYKQQRNTHSTTASCIHLLSWGILCLFVCRKCILVSGGWQILRALVNVQRYKDHCTTRFIHDVVILSSYCSQHSSTRLQKHITMETVQCT